MPFGLANGSTDEELPIAEAILEHCYMRLYYGRYRDIRFACDVEPYGVLRGASCAGGLSDQILKHDNNSIACTSGRSSSISTSVIELRMWLAQSIGTSLMRLHYENEDFNV